jgi:predicted dehydrogenase
VGDRFAIRCRYSDAEALLRDEEVDAVLVSVPPRAHASIVLAALDAGKHLLVEKPLCLDLDEADRLVDRARRVSLTAMVGFNLRFHRHMRAARHAIEGGLVGDAELTRTTWSSGLWQAAGLSEWRRHRRLGGGVVNELAVHYLDLWRFLFRSEVCEVFAATHSDDGDDTRATITVRLENGVLALGGFAHRGAAQHEIEIVGRAGRLLVSPYRFDGFRVVPASTSPDGLRARLGVLGQTLSSLPGVLPLALRGGQFLDCYRAEWRHFVDGVRRGTPVDSTLEDGRRAVELVLAAQHSARIGRPVAIGRGHRHAGEILGT